MNKIHREVLSLEVLDYPPKTLYINDPQYIHSTIICTKSRKARNLGIGKLCITKFPQNKPFEHSINLIVTNTFSSQISLLYGNFIYCI